MNIMMQLRKVCNHPYLLPGVEERLLQGNTTTATPSKKEVCRKRNNYFFFVRIYLHIMFRFWIRWFLPLQNLFFSINYSKNYGKICSCSFTRYYFSLFCCYSAAKSRVLIFSQFVMLLDVLEDYMNYKSYPYERLD